MWNFVPCKEGGRKNSETMLTQLFLECVYLEVDMYQ